MVDNVLSMVNNDVTEKEYLEDISNLDEVLQLEVFRILWLAFKNTMFTRIPKGLPITLPYLGTLKIRHKNKFALKRKQEIALKLGYNDWLDIPRDKLDLALKEVKELTIADIKQDKLINGSRKRKNNQLDVANPSRPKYKSNMIPIKLNIRRKKT